MKNWVKWAGVALGLATGGMLYAQSSNVPTTTDTEKYSILNVTEGDSMNVTSYSNRPINKNETTDMNARVTGGDSRKGVKPRFYAIDPSTAFQMDIDFLNSKEGRDYYASKGKKDQRLILIERFQGFINYLKEAKIAPKKESLEQLSYDLSACDGKLTPLGLYGVEDNLYAFIKEGYDSKDGFYRVIYVAPIISETTSDQYKAIIKADEWLIESQSKFIRQLQNQAATKTPDKPETNQETPKQKAYGTLIFDANANTESFGVRFGGRYNFNDTFGIGAGVSVDILDRELLDVITPMSNKGIYSHLMKEEKGFGFGPYVEGKAGPLTARVGLDYWNLNTITTEQAMQYGNKLGDPNVIRDPKKLVSMFGELMLEMPVAKGVSIKGGAGADTQRKIYGILGIGAQIEEK
jgi:hypothetical protein